MTQTRFRWWLTFLTLLLVAAFVYAQQPVTISGTPAVTVSGTAAVTQSGTWTVQPGNTANTTAWKVDGSAVTQPVSGTVTANMGTVTADPFGANADAASATGSISAKLRFIASTGIPITGTVTVASHAVTNAGTFAVQAAQSGNWTARIVGNAGAIVDGATGAAPPANVVYIGGIVSGATGGLLGGLTICDQKVNVSLTANTQLISGVSGRNVFICHYELVAAAATNVALVEGTGSTCGTGTAGMAGGSTAATGWNFAANGGLSSGGGIGWITKTSTAADNVCLLVSAANQVSGVITYAIY